jgi:hypothetical protein
MTRSKRPKTPGGKRKKKEAKKGKMVLALVDPESEANPYENSSSKLHNPTTPVNRTKVLTDWYPKTPCSTPALPLPVSVPDVRGDETPPPDAPGSTIHQAAGS